MELSLFGKSTDISRYIDEHPGGRAILQKYVDTGQDATPAFERVGHSAGALRVVEKLYGTIPTSSSNHRITKLFTHEDYMHLHKACGLLVLLHCAWCYTNIIRTSFGSFQIVPSMMVTHALLALLGLQFPVEDHRIRGTQNMTTEQVYHTVIFSFRSIFVFLAGVFFPAGPLLRVGVVVAHHLAADWVTRAYHRESNGTTIRGGTADAWVPPWLLTVRNYYAGMAQFGATAALLSDTFDPSDAAILSLIPIQLGAFVNTLTKKQIVGSLGHGVIYGGALLVSYAYMAIHRPVVLLYAAGCIVLRARGVNKYLLMLALVLLV